MTQTWLYFVVGILRGMSNVIMASAIILKWGNMCGSHYSTFIVGSPMANGITSVFPVGHITYYSSS